MVTTLRQFDQVRNSTNYDDNLTELGISLETGSSSLEFDLNAIRTQLKKIMGSDDWYTTPAGDILSLSSLIRDLDSDTKITTENATDEDVIRFYAGTLGEVMTINENGDGNVIIENDLLVNGSILEVSDIIYKENIIGISGALDKIDGFRGVYFNWKDDQEKVTQMGFIAQEVEPVIPEAVTLMKDGSRAITYRSVVTVLFEAVKELKGKVIELEKRVGN